MKHLLLAAIVLLSIAGCTNSGTFDVSTSNVTIFGDDDTGGVKAFRVDNLTQSFVSLPYDHFELHQGHVFGYATTQNLSGSGNVTILLKTHPTLPIHYQADIETIAEASMTLYEAVVVSNNGTAQTLVNRNRTSNKTAQSLVFLNPTVTNFGTQIYSKRWGSGKGIGGGAGIEEGWVFKPNTWYAVVVKNEAVTSQYVSLDIVEYIH